MARTKLDLRGDAYRKVRGVLMGHWRHQPGRVFVLFVLFMQATVADVLTPLYAGNLVSAVTNGVCAVGVLNAALWAFALLIALGLGAVVVRQFAFMVLIQFTLKIMADIAQRAFHRVQRFSTDWHANSFAGSTVRKVTRGMWGVDSRNDVLIILLFPALVMLIGTSILLGFIWPVMGRVIGLGSLVYIGLTVVLSVGYVSPAATLANAWDTRMGGALADAISRNAVVNGFGAEDREEELLSHGVGKWRTRTERTWKRGTLNGGFQGATLIVLRTAIVGVAILLWHQGVATAGDIALVLTSFFVLQGYLRDIGQHVRNLQRAVNDMEELVEVQFHPLGIEDRPNAKPAMIEEGEVKFDHATFQYGKHATRLYDVNEGGILIDGHDIREATQASLRGQIAIVQQEPILFHRSLAENIAYARPGATRQEIIAAAKLASAHEFIAGLPKGYETMVGERGVKLRGGERQRVAIARAFLADAPILILDEATSSLDSESEVLIQKAMERLMVGRTTIVIAHRLSTVRSLDRLLVFDKGKIVEEGTHEQLVKREGGIYRRLFERQALELTKGLAVARPCRCRSSISRRCPRARPVRRHCRTS